MTERSDGNKIKRLEDQANRYADNSVQQHKIFNRIETIKNRK